MNTLFFIKAGDLLPPFRATLYAPDGQPQNLAGATVRFHVRRSDGTALFDQPVSAIEDAPGGVVRYDWQPGETGIPGRYTAELEAVIAGKNGTWPNDRDIVITVTPSFGDFTVAPTAVALTLVLPDPMVSVA